jgi:hypothetical protein
MLRRIFAVALVVLGVYYAGRGCITLLRLPAVTHRWIELSGDPDFRLDYQMFLMLIGAGAVMVALLGTVTAWRALRMARADDVRWGALTVAAPLIHVPWLIYRAIATGAPVSPSLQASASLRMFAMRSVVVCVAYVIAWALTRRQRLSRVAG